MPRRVGGATPVPSTAASCVTVIRAGPPGSPHRPGPRPGVVVWPLKETRSCPSGQQNGVRLGNRPSNNHAVLNNLFMLPTGIDALDARLIRALCDVPRAGVMELARQLGVARGTVQARLDKLQQRGIISGFDPDLHLETLGYEVLAFVTLEIAQGRLSDVIDHLADIPEVIEAHSTTGPGDLHCRV